MLAYAPRPDRQRARPATLIAIVVVHAVLLGLVATAQMDIPMLTKDGPIVVEHIPLDPLPPERPVEQAPTRPAPDSGIDTPPVIIPLPAPGLAVDLVPPLPNTGPVVGPAVDPVPPTLPLDPPVASTGPRFRTPAADVRPPYPDSRREIDREASLRLRLAIDARGRVTAVEPVGRADPVFLETARRHILSKWRYQPATEGGTAVASSTVITLTFRLD